MGSLPLSVNHLCVGGQLLVQVHEAHVLVTHGNRWFITRVLLQKIIIYEFALEQVHDIQ